MEHDRGMRIVEVNAVQPRTIEEFGSRGFTIGTLCPDAYVAAATLAAGGKIGRHPAVVDQCLLVLEGAASVSGEDGSTVAIEAGQAALWMAGEQHETRTDDGARVLIVEGRGLADRLS
jgi:mannose-6-phosphate isomerase-like protein (cupin superfamily)